MIQLKELEKQNKPKSGRRIEPMKIRTEMNESWVFLKR
jgi:hypothetical protein